MADLPPALRAAIDAGLAGVSRKDLAGRAAVTSAAYRGGGGSAGVIRAPEDALAYALVRLPATFAACAAVLDEARRRAPDFAPSSLLDAGAGPGGGSWAALQAFPEIEEVELADASAPFLTLAERLGAHGPEPLRGARFTRTDLAGPEPLVSADLVLASYALAEIPEPKQAQVVRKLWAATQGLLCLVEPGTPAGHRRLLAARDELIAADARIAAPCPHHAPCALVGGDWCHFSVRLARSRDHRLAKGAEAPFEDEKFAYLIAAREAVAAQRAAGRILSHPRAGKPGIELKVCGPEGAGTRFVARRDKAAHARARRFGWGDTID